MAENTLISWADFTFNPWEGCQKVGPGCDNCYAEARNARYGGGVAGNWGPGAPRRRTSAANWKKPMKWNREAKDSGARPFVFCSSLADVFDNAVDPAWRADLFELIRATPNLTWLLLTKRPGNIVRLFAESLRITADEHGSLSDCWPRNAAIGCTVVNQEEADRDIPKLLDAKVDLRPAFAFLSMEPLLGPVDLTSIPFGLPIGNAPSYRDALRARVWMPSGTWAGGHTVGDRTYVDLCNGVDWIITGGESGPNARPSNPQWFRDLRDQCAEARIPFHFKQWGEWASVSEVEGPGAHHSFPDGRTVRRIGKARAGHLLDGREHLGRPHG